jgi:ketosteroid isomerase-like protein
MTSTAANGRNERLMNRLVEIIGANDFDALGEVLHEDFVQEMPQSGEVVRGIDNYKAILANYPGRDQTPIQGEVVRTIGEEPHYVMTPTFNLERVQGQGDNPVGVFTLRYPDGSRWWGIWFITIRDDKVARSLDFFAPEFPAPEWRAQWVET